MGLLTLGYFGLFLGTLVSATFFPFPSDVFVIGFYELEYSAVPVVIVATCGNLLGSIVNYYIGYYANNEKLIKRFKLNESKLEKWRKRFDKWGVKLGFISWVPLIGEPMTAALGFFRVDLLPLSVTMFIGKMIRYIGLSLIYFNMIA